MTHHAWISLALLLALAGAPIAGRPLVGAAAVPESVPPDSIAARADRYLGMRTTLGQFSGAALIARGQRVLLRKGYGFADVERRVAYAPETRHAVASISKMFTAMAALKLRDQGRLDLQASITRYLDDCPASWTPITVRDLMRHTSGIPDYEEALELGSPRYLEFMVRPQATAEIVAEAKRKPLDFKPGEKFHYSNTGYIVLSRIVERVSGQPFATYVTSALLRPAGMSRSGVFDGRGAPEGLAAGYTHGDLGWEKTLAGVALDAGHLKRMPQLALTPPAGDGGMYSTIDDLLRWSRVMDGGTLVPAAEAAEVFTPGLERYGYGWFVDQGFDRRRMRHNGLLPGYLSDFVKFPDDSLTLVVFSNLDRARLSRIVRDLSAIALGRPYDMPRPATVVTLDSTHFARLSGRFRMADGDTLTVLKEPDLLVAKVPKRYEAGLIPLSPLEFFVPLTEGRAIFTLDERGRATRINMRYSGEDHLGERISEP